MLTTDPLITRGFIRPVCHLRFDKNLCLFNKNSLGDVVKVDHEGYFYIVDRIKVMTYSSVY